MNYTYEFEKIISEVSTALGRKIDMNKVRIVDQGLPHTPKSLPPKTMAVYAFIYRTQFLKIGRVDTNSNNRFRYQHYSPNAANSTLARSLLSDPDMLSLGLSEQTIGQWIKDNCRRIDIFLDSELGVFSAELIEAILHYKYTPKYEGKVERAT